MPEIIVKGIDSADAMEQVEKLLGPEALILKTVRRGSQVEITATTDAPAGPRRLKREPAAQSEPQNNRVFAQMLAESLKKQHAAALDPVVTDVPSDDPKDVVKEAAIAPAPSPENPSQTPLVLTPGGYLIMGQSGAGKSQLALQLAASFKQETNAKPRLVYLGQGSLADAAYLVAKARIMGIAVLHRTVEDLNNPDLFIQDRDIIVVSDTIPAENINDLFANWRRLLVMPTGLTPAAQSATVSHWDSCQDVILSQTNTIQATEHDLVFQTSTPARAIGISTKTKILDALHEIDFTPLPDDTATKTDVKVSAPSIFKNRWAGQSEIIHTNPAPQSVGMPMLGTRPANRDTKFHQQEGAEQ